MNQVGGGSTPLDHPMENIMTETKPEKDMYLSSISSKTKVRVSSTYEVDIDIFLGILRSESSGGLVDTIKSASSVTFDAERGVILVTKTVDSVA